MVLEKILNIININNNNHHDDDTSWNLYEYFESLCMLLNKRYLISSGFFHTNSIKNGVANEEEAKGEISFNSINNNFFKW